MTTFSTTVTANTDDGVSEGTGWVDDANKLYFGTFVGANQYIGGFRFQNVTIPQGATINSAFIDFVTNYGGSYDTHTKTKIYGQAADTTVTFSSGSQPKDRALTTASVNWNSAAGSWSPGTLASATVIAPPDIKTIIQEIVNRAGWVSGNSIVIIVKDNAGDEDWGFEMKSYNDAGVTNAPRIAIDYTAGGGSASFPPVRRNRSMSGLIVR